MCRTSTMLSGSRTMVGGPDACIVKPHSKPWAVRFTIITPNGTIIHEGTSCGGTLISKNLVLTAAHCGVGQGRHAAMVGEHDVENRYDQQIIGIEREINYPNYKGTEGSYAFLIKNIRKMRL